MTRETSNATAGERILNFAIKIKDKTVLRLRKNVPTNEFDFGRDVFAEEITSKIIQEHSKSNASFIFGISADWGEGKTYLLKKIEKKLQNNGFTIIWFSPWKYSEDKITLMRMFIRILNQKLKRPLRINLSDFDRDRTTLKLDFKLLILLIFIGILIFFVYQKFLQSYVYLFTSYSSAFLLLIIPIITGLILKLLAIQQDQKILSTVDKFDSKLDKILARYWLLRKKVVVFVDDLDRVHPKEAKVVLDGLRTFFDKSQLTYIVTGDNKILEDAVAQSMEKTGDGSSEEGRRFLKKIFNVYWRMPLPSQSQIKSFIKNRLTESPFAKQETDKFSEWMLRYFDLNPRNIERFIETITFNIHTLEKQNAELGNEAADEEKKRQIQEVLTNKILLVRALILQEKTFSLFEKIVSNPMLIRDIEKSLDDGQADLSGFFTADLKLTDLQKNFLSQFLLEEPRFYKDGSLTVNLVPFFKLTSEVGLSDERGISPDAFLRFLDQNDKIKLKQGLSIGGDFDSLAISAQQKIDSEKDAGKKLSMVDALLDGIEDVQNNTTFLKSVAPNAINQLKDHDEAVTIPLFAKFFKYLDTLPEKEAGEIATNIAYSRVENFNLITEGLNKNSTLIALNWLKSYLNQDKVNALNKFNEKRELLANISEYDFINESEQVSDEFNNLNSTEKENAFNFLTYTTEGIKIFKRKMKQNYSTLNENQRNELIALVKNKFGNGRWGENKVKQWMDAS